MARPSTAAPANWVVHHARGLAAVGAGLLAFVGLFATLPPLSIPGNLIGAAAGALLVELVVSLVVGAIIWIGYALIGHKVKEWEDQIGLRDCPDCRHGKVACKTCEESGEEEGEVLEQVQCPTCKGTAIVALDCSPCGATGSISRPARFASQPGQPVIRWDWNLSRFGHFEDVSVSVTNIDETPATFFVEVGVMGGNPPSLSASFPLPPGQSATPTFTFKVHGKALRPVQSRVVPSTVRATCPECRGTGRNQAQCPTCHGNGTVPEKKQVTVPCHSCKGEKSVTCTRCSGSGRVRRIG